jgi:6,7-dimethyl-8-ribityllumazine synthase
MKESWLDKTGMDFLKHNNKFEIGIVCAEWNASITSKLLEECQEALHETGVLNDKIHLVRVPGTFELPAAMKILMSHKNCDVIIGLGCVIKGSTDHDEYINHAVATGMTQLSLISNTPCIFGVLTTKTNTPCIFGVLTTKTAEQALKRADGTVENKGRECAFSAIRMAQIKNEIKNQQKDRIGFI